MLVWNYLYKGNNVKHARDFLEKVKTNFSFPPRAQELALACYVGSYTQRERTQKMVDAVKEFADKYPESKFLSAMVEPVRQVKKGELKKLFDNKKYDLAVKFYEENKEKLFSKNMLAENKFNLFNTYFLRGDVTNAKDFWIGYKEHFSSKRPKEIGRSNVPNSMSENIKRLVFLEEVTNEDETFKEELASFQEEVNKLEEPNFENIDNFLVTRLKLADKDMSTLPVLVKVVLNSGRKNVQGLCEVFVPTISKYLNQNPSEGVLSEIAPEIKSIIELNYMNMAKDGLDCADGLLDLELKVYQKLNRDLLYAKNWHARMDWGLTKIVLAHLWSASEIFAQERDQTQAIEIWQKIKDSGLSDLSSINYHYQDLKNLERAFRIFGNKIISGMK